VCAVVHLQVHWDEEKVRIFEVGVREREEREREREKFIDDQ
jgi:hypothetical protein